MTAAADKTECYCWQNGELLTKKMTAAAENMDSRCRLIEYLYR
jgi:hypothetical protein